MSCLRIDLKPRFDDTPKYVNIVIDGENKELFISKNDKLYDEFLGKPLSEKSHHLLHTSYQPIPLYKR